MDSRFCFNIDNVFNIFSSSNIDILQDKYHIDKYYHLKQIHSDKVYIVDNNYQNNQEGDALITNKINMPLVIKTADCIPILLYDKENKVLALVHSGWMGVLKNITKNTLDTMKDKYNSKGENIDVYIYPSIRKCHFCVKDDVYQKFMEKIENIEGYTTKKSDSYYINLQEIVIDILKKYGIKNIHDANICTYEDNNNFYSYRFNHTDKRNYLVAYIKE